MNYEFFISTHLKKSTYKTCKESNWKSPNAHKILLLSSLITIIKIVKHRSKQANDTLFIRLTLWRTAERVSFLLLFNWIWERDIYRWKQVTNGTKQEKKTDRIESKVVIDCTSVRFLFKLRTIKNKKNTQRSIFVKYFEEIGHHFNLLIASKQKLK